MVFMTPLASPAARPLIGSRSGSRSLNLRPEDAPADGAWVSAIYARISDDPQGLALGVQRQIADCQKAVESRNLPSARTYIDNDVSATRAKVRPEYQRMLADVRSGLVRALVVWDVDRLTRTPRELEDVIDLADRYGLQLISIGGEIDLSTSQGRMTARIKGAVARQESENISRRVKRKYQERAENGLPSGGQVAYGYRRITGPKGQTDVLDEFQAPVIRWAASAVLGGLSLRFICAQLNAPTLPEVVALNGGQPIPTARTAAKWTSPQIRNILIRERNAGRREYLGQVVGQADWPAVYVKADGSPDPDMHDRVVALLAAPDRLTGPNYRGRTYVHLLSSIAVCGICGEHVHMVKSPKSKALTYGCRDGHVSRRMEPVDEMVREAMIAWLADSSLLVGLTEGDSRAVEEARTQKAQAKARLDLAVSALMDGTLDPRTAAQALQRAQAAAAQQIEAADAVIAANLPPAIPTHLAGNTAEEQWDGAPLEAKRTLIRLAFRVEILKARPGRRPFDPNTVRLTRLVRGGGA